LIAVLGRAADFFAGWTPHRQGLAGEEMTEAEVMTGLSALFDPWAAPAKMMFQPSVPWQSGHRHLNN
jgi:hypothetical protein